MEKTMTDASKPEDRYHVYLMTNRPRGVFYVGVTSNLIGRVWQHRTHYHKGSFTDRYNLEKLVWAESYREVGFAIKREKLIKRWIRPWKIALVEKANPEWIDLWEALTTTTIFVSPTFESYNLDLSSQ
jgi:putative endonuclease